MTINWDPNFGELATREIWEGDDRIESELFFLKSSSNRPAPCGLPYISIINHHGGISYIDHGSVYIEYVRTTEEQLTRTRRVKRRAASDKDIHNLLSLWNRKGYLWPDEWIFNIKKSYVDEMKLISEKEFHRLNDITSEYIKIGNPLNKFPK